MFASADDNRPGARSTTWARMVAELTRHLYLVDKSRAKLWSPARYAPGATRGKANVIDVCVFAFDIDDGTGPDTLAYWLRGLDCVITSSFSHTPAHPKLRPVIRLTSPIPGAEYDSVWRRANQHLLHGHVDPSTKDAGLMFYLPSCPPGSETVELVLQGRPLDWRLLPPLPEPRPLANRKLVDRPDASNAEKRADALLAKWEREIAAEPPGQAERTGRHWLVLQKARAAGGLVASGLLGEDAVSRALFAAAQSNGLVADDGEHAVRRVIADGLSHGKAEPWTPDDLPDSPTWMVNRRFQTTRNGVLDTDTGEMLPPPPARTDTTSLHGAVAEPAASPPVAQDSRFRFTALEDLLAQPPEITRFVVDGLLPSAGVSLIGAKPKVGKSVLARNLAMSVASGTPFLGRAVTQGKVLLLALEEKRTEVAGHFRRMGASDELILVHVGAAPATSREGIAALAAAIAEHQPIMAIGDPVLKLVRVRDSSDYAELTRELEPVIELARNTGVHIAVTHHLGKLEREGGDDVLGSTAIFGAVDTLMVLRRRKDTRRFLMTIQRYGADLAESLLPLDETTGLVALGGELSGLRHSEACEAVLALLGTLGDDDEALDQKTIREKAGVDSGLVPRALQELLAEPPRIVRLGAGKRNDPYRYRLQEESLEDPEKKVVSGFSIYRETTKPETQQIADELPWG